jgi:glycosyltransferase involved in cell wall biosynthesis
MTDALAAADACVAILKPIELYKTTYPNKVFDYMAAGRPVILAIDGVIRAVVEDAQAGIFVTPGDAAEMADAIRTLAADPALGRKMGLAGRQYIETKFNRSDIAAVFGKLLDEVMRHE